jgi:hypothetical protein
MPRDTGRGLLDRSSSDRNVSNRRKPRRSQAAVPARAQRGHSATWWRRVLGYLRSGWAAIPILATLIGLGFTVRHELNSAPPSRGAALSHLSLTRHVSFGQYLDLIQSPRTPYNSAQLAREGVYLEYDVSVTGYKGKLLPLRWILLDDSTNNLVRQAEALRIKPRAEHDAGSWASWVPIPRGGRRYVVRLQLYDDQTPATPLAHLDSSPFQLSP